jgi:hypothetical protein
MGEIRRGKIGGSVDLVGQAGNPGPGWDEILRVTDVTAGDPVTREGGEANSEDHTIFSAFVITGDGRASTLPPPRIHLRIEIADGNDAGSAKVVYRVLAGAPVSVSGSLVIVSAQIFLDEVGVVQAPPNVTAHVDAYVSVGDGQDVEPTLWPRNLPDTGVPTPPLGSQGQITIGPGRMKAVQGFSASATDTYLMFFDWPGPNILPPPGSLPLWTIKLPAGATYSDDNISSTRAVTYGYAWACSSTPDVLTYDGTQAIRVDAEMYAGQDLTTGSLD